MKKKSYKRHKSTITRNESIVGVSIEVMLEQIENGDGVEHIEDRDLVYNDNETERVNPITNIRSDKMEIMLEEKIGGYEHGHKMRVVKEEEKGEEGGGEEVVNE